MNATIDLKNRVINGLLVIGRVSLSAAHPRWRTRCERCHSESTWDHSKLINAMSTSSGTVARCTYSNCNIGQTGLKPNKIKELEPLDGVPITARTTDSESLGASHPLSLPKIVIKELSEYERVCKSRAFFDNQPMSHSDYAFIRDYKKPFYNRVLAEIDAWQEATGGF